MALAISSGASPMGELNTTPLIDVLLVLLVMFVITIPPATHSLPIDLPGPGPTRPDPVSNTIVVTAQDTTLWNGREVGAAELAGLLAASAGMQPEPQLRFEPEANASYEASARVILQVKAAGVTNFGFAGNERYRQFGRSE